MKEFKKGLLFGLGILAILVPVIAGIGVVQAINDSSPKVNMQASYAPENYLFYTFAEREFDYKLISTATGKSIAGIAKTINNYLTSDGKSVDIIIFSGTGLTTLQQDALRVLYPNKIIQGVDRIPDPYVPPTMIIK